MTQVALTPLRRIRQARQLSLDKVAEAIEMNNATLSRLERGEIRTTPATAEKLVQFFGEGITEMEILYPERFQERGEGGHVS